jgi:DNA-binding CsgD family transcriptional regulator
MADIGLTLAAPQVCALTARGLSTAEMAQRLHISANTVQDHLKSIFEKTGARNRRELVSRIFVEEHAPSIEQPPGAHGPLHNHR